MKKQFSQDLYEEVSRRQNLTDENLTTDENLRALAVGLAADSKYGGVLSSHKFSRSWLLKFRKKFRNSGEKSMDGKQDENVAVFNQYIPGEEADIIRETFSQDLYKEMCRRQSLSGENLTTNEKLRALAVELAADPKYQAGFGPSWRTLYTVPPFTNVL